MTHEMGRLKLATWTPKVWSQRTPVHDVGAVPWVRVRARAPKQPGAPAAYITLSGADSLIGCAVSTNCSEALWRVMSQSECGTLRLTSIDKKDPKHCSLKLADVQRIDKKTLLSQCTDQETEPRHSQLLESHRDWEQGCAWRRMQMSTLQGAEHEHGTIECPNKICNS